MTEQGGGRKLFLGITWNILVAGIVSFFMDVSSEMVYAVGALYLTALGTTPALFGVVEGLAEATAAVFKLLSGALADRFQRYKPLVTIGYFISVMSRPISALAPSWHQYLGGRIVDRLGKGVRTSPRDAMLAASADRKSYGKSFGFHRAMDQMGAIIGPVLAAGVLALYATAEPTLREFRVVIWWSLAPGLLAVIATLFLIETGKRKAEKKEGAAKEEARPAAEAASPAGDARKYWYFLAVMMVFSLGNSSNIFLLKRAQDLGMDKRLIPLVYALMNIVYVAASIPWGAWADRAGFRRVILTGFGVFSAVYFGFGAARAPWAMWVLFPAYGLFESAFEGQSRAYLARLAKAHLRGTAFGMYNMLLALTALPASLVAGYLYDKVAPEWAFYYGGITAAAAFVMLGAERLVLGRTKTSA